jgi:protein-tyrosine phosphatase
MFFTPKQQVLEVGVVVLVVCFAGYGRAALTATAATSTTAGGASKARQSDETRTRAIRGRQVLYAFSHRQCTEQRSI